MTPSRMVILIAGIALCAAQLPSNAADDASAAYREIEPSLVKVWALDASGTPIRSGTGFVVSVNLNNRSSLILTADHVLANADKVTIDVDRRAHDMTATVVFKSESPDIALLQIDRGDLKPVRFAPESRVVRAGSLVAVAGFFKSDEQIGVTGQAPRLRYPGTVSSLPDDGRYIELSLPVEEGLSGAPVFDPEQGDVIGMLQTRSSDGQGGYALSAARLVLPFLERNHVAVAIDNAAPAAPPPQKSVAVEHPAPRPVTSQSSAQLEYHRILDGLHASDVVTQLSTLDEAAQMKDASLRRLALTTAIASAQEPVRAAALRWTIALSAGFPVEVVRMTQKDCVYGDCNPNNNNTPLSGAIMALRSFTVHVRQFDRDSGSFQTFSDFSKGTRADHPLVVSEGSVSGESVTFAVHFDQRPAGPYYEYVDWNYQFDCSGTVRLSEDATLRGPMDCRGGVHTAGFDVQVVLR